MTVDQLLSAPLKVVNIGLAGFAEDLRHHGVPVVQLDWSPPAKGDPKLAALVARLNADERIDAANREALARMLKADLVAVDVRPAREVVPRLKERMVLHAGPPVPWERMCGPLRAAVQGACVLEGWAPDLAAAEKLVLSGGIQFGQNHDHDAVGPMAGITTISMPVFVVENRAFGNRAYVTINEGMGKVMRYGANDAEVLTRLRWFIDKLGPALGAALRQSGGLALKPIVARGLSMGDENHMRNQACSALFLRAMAPLLARAVSDQAELAKMFEFLGNNEMFFLNVAMAMGKAITDPARGIEASSVVTTMARNGTEFGIRVSGTGPEWFAAPSEQPRGVYFPGYTAKDANPDIGDSAIVETIGLGGFAMATAPAVVSAVGGTVGDALNYTRAMYDITVGRSPDWTMPALDFAGVPVGIDIRKVVETGIRPTINTGIAHRLPGIGQVGAGIVNPPFSIFERALFSLAAKLGIAP
ncbi:MAG: DUF1116 domain-containing protein [Alphaproteobacteria bacterium]|nr:DUF1116 domain-containing protein [Alphaproteobacteria bacterium]